MVSSEVEVAVDPDTGAWRHKAWMPRSCRWNSVEGASTSYERRTMGWLEYDAARDWLPVHDQAELQRLEHLAAHQRA
jgi:hypothetical protein